MKNRFIESQWLGIMHDSGDFCRGTFFLPGRGSKREEQRNSLCWNAILFENRSAFDWKEYRIKQQIQFLFCYNVLMLNIHYNRVKRKK